MQSCKNWPTKAQVVQIQTRSQTQDQVLEATAIRHQVRSQAQAQALSQTLKKVLIMIKKLLNQSKRLWLLTHSQGRRR